MFELFHRAWAWLVGRKSANSAAEIRSDEGDLEGGEPTSEELLLPSLEASQEEVPSEEVLPPSFFPPIELVAVSPQANTGRAARAADLTYAPQEDLPVDQFDVVTILDAYLESGRGVRYAAGMTSVALLHAYQLAFRKDRRCGNLLLVVSADGSIVLSGKSKEPASIVIHNVHNYALWPMSPLYGNVG